MVNKTPIEEAFCDIRNGAVNLIAILRRFDKNEKTLVSVWYEGDIESERIRDAFKMIKENL
jgi:hypothetical protein